ncbi:MAG: UbiA family prenyltransferase, partial [Simkaniaceae bacterium]|nr:UbiA family prenyltransferase [Simkaniaceae bacterium]
MNNMRDIEEDRASGKKTIAVRFGLRKCKMIYLIQICLTGGVPSLLVMATGTHFWTPLANIAFVPLLPALRALLNTDKNNDYNNYFIITVKTLIFYTIAFCVTYAL